MTALSRLRAVARSPWDWDEMLFCLSLRNYDVALHHPHPPGFPFFVALAKLIRPLAGSDFRAFQLITVAASMILFPALVDLGREVGMKPGQAMAGALLCCFFPNVWFYGGTAFSDVFSLTLSILAVTLLLRGRRSRSAYWGGAALLGCAIAVRPQNLLVGGFALLWTSWARRRKPQEIVVAFVILSAIAGAFFGAAAVATGSWQKYATAISEHRSYILANDSFRSPARPPLHVLFWDFFFRQYQFLAAGYVVSSFVLIAVWEAIRRRQHAQMLLGLVFGPFCLVVWLMLDRFSISRFAVAYMPCFALLAVIGMAAAGRLLIPKRPELLVAIATALLVLAFIGFSWRPLSIVRTTDSPPVAAMMWTREHLRPGVDSLFLGFGLTPFHDYDLPDFTFIHVHDANAVALGDVPGAYLLSEGEWEAGERFSRERGALWKIARHHYFDVIASPAIQHAEWSLGWGSPERAGSEIWRWMGSRGEVRLPSWPGKVRLSIELVFPPQLMAAHAVVDVYLDGHELGSIEAAPIPVTRSWDLKRKGGDAFLSLVSSATTPDGEGRPVSVRLRALSWGPPPSTHE